MENVNRFKKKKNIYDDVQYKVSKPKQTHINTYIHHQFTTYVFVWDSFRIIEGPLTKPTIILLFWNVVAIDTHSRTKHT